MGTFEIRKRGFSRTFAVAFALVVAMFIACVLAPVSFAFTPPATKAATFVGTARTSNIGYGLKADSDNFYGSSHLYSNDYNVYFKIELGGKAKRHGIYMLAVYYKNHKVGTASFGVAKGTVSKKISAKATITSKGAIDRSQIKVKRVKFIPGYKLNLGKTYTKTKYNGLKLKLNKAIALKNTKKNPRIKTSINGEKFLYIVKKNAKVKLCIYGRASSKKGAKASGLMSATVKLGGKKISGDIITVKGADFTGDVEYGASSKATNWQTSAIKISKDMSAKIKSVKFAPFALASTGTGSTSSIGNGISATTKLVEFSESFGDWFDDTSGVTYNVRSNKTYYIVGAFLSGTASTYPVLQKIKLNYAGDQSNLNFTGANTSFVVANSYAPKVEDENYVYFKIPVKNPRTPTTFDLSKLSYTYTVESDIVKVRTPDGLKRENYGGCVIPPPRIVDGDVSGSLFKTWRNDLCLSITARKSFPTFKTTYFYDDSRLIGCAKKGSTLKFNIRGLYANEAKKSGTLKYTLKVNGKAYKTWTKKVKKGKSYYGKWRSFSIKADSDIKLSLNTKFTPAKKAR
jgi:hypothetical protein